VFKVIKEAQGLKAHLAQLGRKVPLVQALAMETQRETSSIGMDPYGKT